MSQMAWADYAPQATEAQDPGVLMRYRLVAALYAVWLVLYLAVPFYLLDVQVEDGSSALLAGAVLAFAGVPIFVQIWAIRLRHTVNWQIVSYIFAFAILMFVSHLFSPFASMTSFLSPVAMVVAFAVCVFAVNVGQPGLLPDILRFYAILMAGMMVVMLLDGDIIWGRLQGRIGPNTWAGAAVTVAFCALAWRQIWIKVPLIGLCAWVIILTQSRTAMAAIAFGLFFGFAVYAFYRIRTQPVKLQMIIGVFALAIVAALMHPATIGFIEEHFLRVGDAQRGLESGLTGRWEVWDFVLPYIQERPLIGYGYRLHGNLFESFITSSGDYSIRSAHNAYIAMALDMGLPGLMLYAAFLGYAFWRAIRVYGSNPAVIVHVCFIAAFIVYGMAERRAINAGSPLSLIFIMLSFDVIGQRYREFVDKAFK